MRLCTVLLACDMSAGNTQLHAPSSLQQQEQEQEVLPCIKRLTETQTATHTHTTATPLLLHNTPLMLLLEILRSRQHFAKRCPESSRLNPG